MRSLDEVNQNAVLQFWVEPSRFWRHDLIAIRHFEQVFHRCRKQRKSDAHLAIVNRLPQAFRIVIAADK